MYYVATRFLSLAAALSTLAVMVYAARSWGDKCASQGWEVDALLLCLAVWSILPYVGFVILAKRAVQVRGREILVLVGALIITVGGLAAYVDAIWVHPDPQGGLAFFAVPLYQMIIVGLLAVLVWLVKKRETP